MNLARTRQRHANMEKIRDIIEVSKFATIQELNKISKATNTALEMAVIAKQIFESAAEKYKIVNKYVYMPKEKGKLWILVTLSKSLFSTSYEREFRMVKKAFNHETDKLICIGKPAMQFAIDQKIPPVYTNESLDCDKEVGVFISQLYGSSEVTMVNFVYSTSKVENDPITILPLSKMNYPFKFNEKLNHRVKFYPSLNETLNDLTEIYTSRTTWAIFQETRYSFVREKLVRHEQSLKSIEKKVEDIHRDYIKLSRKINTEELIMITSQAKRKNSSGGENE